MGWNNVAECMDTFRDGPAAGPHKTLRKDKGMARKYDPERIETKWQKVWDEQKTFIVSNPAGGGGAGKGAEPPTSWRCSLIRRAARTWDT